MRDSSGANRDILRWVTWYPAPYWNARFAALAAVPGLDFGAYFLSRSSPGHRWGHDTHLNEFRWALKPTMLPMREPVGERPRSLPLWMVRDLRATLVTPYAGLDLVAGTLVRKALGGRVYFFTGNTIQDARSWRPTVERTKRFLLSMCDGVLVSGRPQSEYVQKYVRAGEKVHTIGNPVDNKDFFRQHVSLAPQRSEIRRRLGVQGPTVLYVGRLSREKGVAVLMQACAALETSSLPHLSVLVAGAGPEERRLRALAKELGVRTQFMGFREGLELLELYEAADVLVLPSSSEAWGLVVNEAMLFEKPVVVSDRVGAGPELVRVDENGYIFPTGRPDALAKVIHNVLHDPSRTRLMGKRSLEIIRHHDIDSWVERVLHAVLPRGSEAKTIPGVTRRRGGIPRGPRSAGCC